MATTWSATRYEKDCEAEVGRWHLVVERGQIGGWSASVTLSGIPMGAWIGLSTPGDAFDKVDDFVAAYKPRKK